MKLHKHEGQVCNVLIGYDDTTAEQWAMLAAMFSRSASGVEELADKVRNTDGHDFMSKFYVGYGHASIGDLCDVKLFIEGVPFYVACLLEHYSRFRGQEASTRYIDFSKQAPAIHADLALYEKQIDTYLNAVEKVSANLQKSRTVDAVEKRAINARAFDICRSLLPWGCTTNVAWYGDIRSIEQHLAWLVSYRNLNAEIADIHAYVNDIRNALLEMYPSSLHSSLEEVRVFDNYPLNGLPQIRLRDFGELDMGSWRDLNRHRLGCSTIDYRTVGQIHPWYVEALTAHGIEVPDISDEQNIDNRLLGQLVTYNYLVQTHEHMDYLLRLRSGTSVHPTLRELCLKADTFCTYRHDPDPGPFGYFLQRGNQTIFVNGQEL